MFLYSIFTLLIILISLTFYLIKIKLNYWEKKGVPHLKPYFIFGNYKEYILLQKHVGHAAQEICRKFPNEPYIGTYYGTEPALVIQDPELIKLILVKDFNVFNGREITKYCAREPNTNSVFFNGGQAWKVLRYHLSSLFSSSKMKTMFYLIQNCRNVFEELLKKETESTHVEVKSLATKYVMDCIGSCVFGINTNVMIKSNDSINPFAVIGEKIFSTTKSSRIKFVIRTMWPIVFYGLRFRFYSYKIHKFFYQTLENVFESRNYKQTSRNDLIDQIMPWRSKGYLVVNERDSNGKDISMKLNLNDEIIAAQCSLFFGAGFETSSSAISFSLFELAKNKDAQTKLHREVDYYLDKNNGKIEYDCINDLPYLEACLNETMRLYPVLGVLTRETMQNYTLPSGLHLEKGVRIHIPVHHLHHDSKYFPDPEEFRPERFFGEEKCKITPYTFLPFGEGPRRCLGIRFSKMQIYPAFLTIFKDYQVELMEGMHTKLEMVPGTVVTQCAGGIYLKFIKRNKQ